MQEAIGEKQMVEYDLWEEMKRSEYRNLSKDEKFSPRCARAGNSDPWHDCYETQRRIEDRQPREKGSKITAPRLALGLLGLLVNDVFGEKKESSYDDEEDSERYPSP